VSNGSDQTHRAPKALGTIDGSSYGGWSDAGSTAVHYTGRHIAISDLVESLHTMNVVHQVAEINLHLSESRLLWPTVCDKLTAVVADWLIVVDDVYAYKQIKYGDISDKTTALTLTEIIWGGKNTKIWHDNEKRWIRITIFMEVIYTGWKVEQISDYLFKDTYKSYKIKICRE